MVFQQGNSDIQQRERSTRSTNAKSQEHNHFESEIVDVEENHFLFRNNTFTKTDRHRLSDRMILMKKQHIKNKTEQKLAISSSCKKDESRTEKIDMNPVPNSNPCIYTKPQTKLKIPGGLKSDDSFLNNNTKFSRKANTSIKTIKDTFDTNNHHKAGCYLTNKKKYLPADLQIQHYQPGYSVTVQANSDKVIQNDNTDDDRKKDKDNHAEKMINKISSTQGGNNQVSIATFKTAPATKAEYKTQSYRILASKTYSPDIPRSRIPIAKIQLGSEVTKTNNKVKYSSPMLEKEQENRQKTSKSKLKIEKNQKVSENKDFVKSLFKANNIRIAKNK